MATLGLSDISYGVIEFRRRHFPIGKFTVTSGVAVSEGDLIDIIANYTTTGGTSSTSIYKGRIVDKDFEKIKTILTEAEAEEMEKIRPQGRYSGTLGGLIQDFERDWFHYINLSLSASSPYMYRSPHNFKGVTNGQFPPKGPGDPLGWLNYSGGTGVQHAYVIASALGHQKVLELYSNNVASYGAARYEWNSNKKVNICDMDIWVATNSTTKAFQIRFTNFYHHPVYDGIILRFYSDGKIYYRTGDYPYTWTDSGQTYSANTMMRITLYANGETDTWNMDINGINVLSDIAIWGDINTYYLGGIHIIQEEAYTDHYVWIDAPGFDQTLIGYEQNYTVGTNQYYEYDELNYDTEYMKYILGGDMTLRQFFDMYADQYLYTWYLKPDYELIFNDGAVDSGVDIGSSSNVRNVDGHKQIKNFDKVILLGGFAENKQLVATYGAGYVIVKDTYADITNYDALLSMAEEIYNQKTGNPLSVAMDYLDLVKGYIQVGEEVTIIANTLRFSRSDDFICTVDKQFKIKGVKVYIVNGQLSYIELFLDDVLVFEVRGVEEDLPQQNSALITQVGTGASQTGLPPSASGESNTMANIGVGGIGVYKQKQGVQFQLRTINAASSKITVAQDDENDEVDIEAVAAEIEKEISLANLLEKSHGSLDGVEAAQHHARYEDAEAVAAVEAAGLALDDGKVITSQDADLTFLLGRAAIGYTAADQASFGHKDHFTTSGVALRQTASGTTNLNAPTGASIYHRINNVNKMVMSASALTMSIPIAMGTHKITGLGDPADAQDAATKAYADAIISDAEYDYDLWNITNKGASKRALREVIEPLTSAVYYMGTWTPGSGYPADPRAGDFYIVDTDGYQPAVGSTPARWYEIGDWLVYNSEETMWDIIRNSYGDNVISVSPGDDIQVAIDEIVAVGAGVVFLQPGTHTLTATLTINNINVDIVIRGAYNASIIDCAGDRTAISVTNAKSCVIENFQIDAADITTAGLDLIYVNETSNNKVIVENVNIVGDADKKGVGITIASNNCEILSCICDQLYVGIYVSGSSYSIISNNICKNGGDDGIHYQTGDYNLIISNVCLSNADDGIKLLGGNYNIFTNNICLSNTDKGIQIDIGADNNIFNGNRLLNNGTNFSDSGTGTILFGDDTAYAASWNGNLGTPTKNAVYDKIETLQADLGIGSANKRWKNCILEGAVVFDDIKVLNGEYKNVGAGDAGFAFGIPLDYIKGTHNLVITKVKISLVAADADDYIISLALNSWVGADSSVAQRTDDSTWKTPQVITWDIADLTVGGVFERVSLYIACSNTTASQLEIGYVQVEYYYIE